MSDTVMIRELRNKRGELQAERAAIDAKLTAISTVINMFEDTDERGAQEALTSGTSGNELQISEILESPSPTEARDKSSALSESKGSSANGHPKKLSIAQEVREAVSEFESQFKSQDVVQHIRSKYPGTKINPTTVSTALGRMVNRKESIRVVREGEAWEPNIYERIPHDGSAQENPAAKESSVNS